MNTIPNQHFAQANSILLSPRASSKTRASQRRNDFSLTTNRSQKAPRGLIKISTADGRWQKNWNLDYNLSLQELQLQGLAEDGHNENEVSIGLCIHKHTGFGLSVDGRITTSFTRKCSNCSSSFCREVVTNFTVWILPSGRKKNLAEELPEIGGDDPSVIYVKPGCEADLDSLVQDSIRLAASVKETCSEACENSEPKLHHMGVQNAASVDRRWSRLLELKKKAYI
ncbi:large ribosomal RNA subunit accumulation protein YCED homolog 2, chloroplastic [Coffea eugenioides]|uniref:large ribosomal RNA subunit accumulation protein YCED homolog 2, chloroplastic n=1 Tax=Coffea eugenioides TaxID=49369 RepID=UPI000F614DCA|nr:large ribosomal RNA subunit accumulation protein YCED homolog 2, chloroplastic [Coffea eugenioides]